jgi:hypothetical protein
MFEETTVLAVDAFANEVLVDGPSELCFAPAIRSWLISDVGSGEIHHDRG